MSKYRKRILILFLIIIQLISLIRVTEVSAISDYQTILKKVGVVSTYTKKYKEVGSPLILNASYIASGRYKEGPWFYLEDETLTQELSVDGNNLAELRNLPKLKIPTGEEIDFNFLMATLLRSDTSGGYEYLISYLVGNNLEVKDEGQQYNVAKDFFTKNKNIFLASVDGENLINLYYTNNSVNLETLIDNYYKDTTSGKRYETFVGNLFKDNFDFTKDNLRQQFYTRVLNDSFFMDLLKNFRVVDSNGSYSEYEPLIKNTIYAFSDMVYENYPSLKIEKMEFTYERNALEVNHDYNIPISFSPKNIKEKNLTFSSSDENIASVNENGTLHTNNLGKFVLTASTGAISIKKEFEVFEEGTTVELDKKELNLAIKQGVQLNATITPETSSQKILWESENEQIAKVSKTGYVEAISQGKTSIIASTETGATAECVVTVGQPIYSIKIEDAPRVMEKGSTYELEVTINPENATNSDIVFSSNNEKVIKVDENGILTAVDKGKAKITVQSVSDASVFDEKTITVSSKIQEIICPEDMYVFLGYITPIDVKLNPEDASMDGLEYQVSNDVISVDEKGNIEGNILGDSEILITAKDNPVASANLKVHVVQPVEEIILNSENIKLKKGETFSLTIDVNPTDAYNSEYEIVVDNPSICSLNGINHVTGTKVGETQIIVSAKDGSGVQAVCNVKVVSNIPFFVYILIPLLIILLIVGIVLFINRQKIQAYIRGF